MTIRTPLTFGRRVAGEIGTVRSAVEAALRAEGFGILTEVDFAAAMREKLGIERLPLVILGACNPTLANRAVSADPTVATLLPCSVVLRTDDGTTIVEALDPVAALGPLGQPAVHEVAEEARSKLVRAIAALDASEPVSSPT